MSKKNPDQLHKIKNNVADIKFYGNEPTWESEVIIDDNRQPLLRRGLNWYHYMTDQSDARAMLEDWIRKVRTKTSEKDLKTLGRVSDRDVSSTYAAMARMELMGFPLTAEERTKIWDSVKLKSRPATTANKTTTTTKNPATVPDPAREAIEEYKSALDDAMLEVLYAAQHSTANAFAQANKTNSKHIDGVLAHVSNTLKEFELLSQFRSSGTKNDYDAQLVEGYSKVTPKALKGAIKWLNELQAALNTQKAQAKVVRIQKKKPADKAKMVKKLQLQVGIPEWNIKGADPQQCLGADSIWVYNTRTRKIGVYRAQTAKSLSVKGTSITGFDPATSVQKTLRKPQDQVSQFMQTSVVKIGKWFDGLSTTPHALNARTNNNVVILKVT